MKKFWTIACYFFTCVVLLACNSHSHIWKDATCLEPKTCSECGATEGEALGHDWKAATCTEAKTCSRCGATEGEALGHEWKPSFIVSMMVVYCSVVRALVL